MTDYISFQQVLIGNIEYQFDIHRDGNGLLLPKHMFLLSPHQKQ